jgi:hypothetical protein
VTQFLTAIAINSVRISANTHGRHSGGSTFGNAVQRGAGGELGRDLERWLVHPLIHGVPLWAFLAVAAVAVLVWIYSSSRSAGRGNARWAATSIGHVSSESSAGSRR